MTKDSFSAPRGAKTVTVSAWVLIAFTAAAAVPFAPPFGKWTRLSPDPILSPGSEMFESAGTFNPSVVKKDGKFVMLYRAQDRNGTSSLGYATSDDGVHFTRPPHPELTQCKNDDQDHEVADDVLLQFIEAADEDVTEIVGFSGERIGELSNRHDASHVDDRDQRKERPHRLDSTGAMTEATRPSMILILNVTAWSGNLRSSAMVLPFPVRGLECRHRKTD